MKFRELLWRSSLIWLRFGFAGGWLMALCAAAWFGFLAFAEVMFGASFGREVWHRAVGATTVAGASGAFLYAYIGLISGLAPDPDAVLESSVGKGFGRAFLISALFLAVTVFNIVALNLFSGTHEVIKSLSQMVSFQETAWGAAIIGWIVGAVSGTLGAARKEIKRQQREMREATSQINSL